MQAVIIPPRKPKQYEPLTLGRELGDCLVANTPLYTLCILARADTATQLVDSSGDIVAWKGECDPEKCADKLITEANCFKIEYSWDLLKINEDFLDVLPQVEVEGQVSHLAEVEGNLHLGEGSKILPGVYIEGNVVIGKNCKIGPNAYISGNTTIGEISLARSLVMVCAQE